MFAPGDLPDGNGDCAPFPNETTPNDKVPAEMGAWFESVRELLLAGHIVELTPRGYSMWPTLSPDTDTIYLKQAKHYRPSDIVLASSTRPRGIFLHRIVSMDTDGAILMGDSNLYQTEICTSGEIIGKVVGITRRGREVSTSLIHRLLTLIHRLPRPLRRVAVRIMNLRKKGI